MSRVGNWLTVTVIVAVGTTLTSCSPLHDDTVPTPVPTSTPSVSPSVGTETEQVPEDPTMLPGGTALANREYFDFVNEQLLSADKNPSNEAIVKNLVTAGFAKTDLEMTSDKTSQLRRPSDSIEFSVRVGKSCLIGQFEAGGYTSIVGPVVSGGRCLIGKTKPIR